MYGEVTAVGPFKTGAAGETICYRAVIRGALIESSGYERNSQRNNYTVELRDGLIGLVREFVVVREQLQARIEDLCEKDSVCGSITKYSLSGHQRTVPVADIVEGPLITISCGGFLSLIHHSPSPEAT